MIAPGILWSRARQYEFVELLCARLVVANEAFIRADYVCADSLYHDLDHFNQYQGVKEVTREIVGGDDEYLKQHLYRTNAIMCLNYAMTLLQLSWKSPSLAILKDRCRVGVFNTILLHTGEHQVHAESLNSHEQAMLHTLRGCALLKNGNSIVARIAFSRGRELGQDSNWTEDEEIADMKSTVGTLLKQPLPVPQIQGKSTIASIDFERALLRSLGYDRSLLEDEIVQKPGWSFDSARGTDIQKPFKFEDVASIATSIKIARKRWDPAIYGGGPFAFWVGHPNAMRVSLMMSMFSGM